jgi:hypothetical protein
MKKLLWIIALLVAIVLVYAWMDPEFRSTLMETTGTKQTSTKVYKWQDKNGKWHISNTPPAEGIPYTEQEYLHNTNVIPSVSEGKK